jgi:hypothetical protein
VDDLEDAPLLDAQHRERKRTVAPLARRPKVDGERGLQVGGGGNEQVLAGRGVLVAGAAERVEAVVPDRARREGEPRVGAHERGERREVPTLQRLDVAPRDLALGRRRAVREHPLAPARGQPVAQPLTGPLQHAVHRGHARAEQPRRLAGRESGRVAQDQRRALARGQVLDRRHERDLERLPRGGGLVRVDEAVRVGVEPRNVGGDRRHVGLRVSRGRDVRREQPRRAARQVVQARVRRDAIQPSAERPPPLAPEPLPRAPRARKRLLHEVLGVLERPDHAVAVRLQRAAVAFEEPGEGDLVGVHHRLRPRLPAQLIAPVHQTWDRDQIAAARVGRAS